MMKILEMPRNISKEKRNEIMKILGNTAFGKEVCVCKNELDMKQSILKAIDLEINKATDLINHIYLNNNIEKELVSLLKGELGEYQRELIIRLEGRIDGLNFTKELLK